MMTYSPVILLYLIEIIKSIAPSNKRNTIKSTVDGYLVGNYILIDKRLIYGDFREI